MVAAIKVSEFCVNQRLAKMLSRQFSHDPRIAGMGLGFWETTANGFTLFGHAGDIPGFHSELVIDRINNIVYFVSFSASGGDAVRSNFNTAFYNHFYPSDEMRPTAPGDFASRADKYTGTYKSWYANFSSIEKIKNLPFEVTVTQSPDNGLILSLGKIAKEVFEVEKNLFLAAEPLEPGPTRLAFQENQSGDITGFVIEGYPYISMYKSPWYETTNFSYPALILSLLFFLGVLARGFYQRSPLNAISDADKSAHRAALIVAATNLVALFTATIVVISIGDSLQSEIHTAFKMMLVLPILAFIAGVYQLIKTAQVWHGRLLSSVWERLRYSLVTLAGGFMCWFYWFWNVLGFQYIS